MRVQFQVPERADTFIVEGEVTDRKHMGRYYRVIVDEGPYSGEVFYLAPEWCNEV